MESLPSEILVRIFETQTPKMMIFLSRVNRNFYMIIQGKISQNRSDFSDIRFRINHLYFAVYRDGEYYKRFNLTKSSGMILMRVSNQHKWDSRFFLEIHYNIKGIDPSRHLVPCVKVLEKEELILYRASYIPAIIFHKNIYYSSDCCDSVSINYFPDDSSCLGYFHYVGQWIPELGKIHKDCLWFGTRGGSEGIAMVAVTTKYF